MKQHWCPRTWGAGLLFIISFSIFKSCFLLMLCGDIYAKRKNRPGPGFTAAVILRVMGALSDPTASWGHPCQSCWFVPSWPAPALCCVPGPGHVCRAGLTGSQHPVEFHVAEASSLSWACVIQESKTVAVCLHLAGVLYPPSICSFSL